jgi:hypothetical protein
VWIFRSPSNRRTRALMPLMLSPGCDNAASPCCAVPMMLRPLSVAIDVLTDGRDKSEDGFRTAHKNCCPPAPLRCSSGTASLTLPSVSHRQPNMFRGAKKRGPSFRVKSPPIE